MALVKAWVSTVISFWTILLVDIQITGCNYPEPNPSKCFFKPVYPPYPVVPNSGKCVPPPPKKCDPNSYYYTYDGSCNNLKYPQYGQMPSLMGTFLKQQYSDNYNAPRKMSNGKDLPPARLLTTQIFKPIDDYNTKYNGIYYAFAQFSTHDCSYQVPIPSDKPCCVNGKPNNPMPDACYVCNVPENDPFYSQFNITCLDTTRSVNSDYLNCTDVKPVQAMNYQTPPLDLSFIYGTTPEKAAIIRTFQGGLLKTNASNNDGSFVYPAEIKSCPFGGLTPDANSPCYVQTDNRTMQNSELCMQDLYWFSFHNAVCKELIRVNPSWNDEKLYQECRRITIAVYQHVFYAFIKASIGIVAAEKYGLLPKSSGYRSGYSDKYKIEIMNEMSSTCGRFGHSNVRGNYVDGIDAKEYLPLQLSKRYFNQGFIQGNKSGALRITKMFLYKSCQRQDNWIVDDLNNKLFAPPSGILGGDLSCTDVNRGREYGQPGYNDYRKMCGLPEVTTWAQFYNITMDTTVVDALMKLYPNPGTADLYTMGLLEKKCDDSSMGSTFTCVLGAQFYLLINADRLWYDNPSAKFTMLQLQIIRQFTMAAVLCIVIPSLDWVPLNAFYIPSYDNPLVACKYLRNLLNLLVFAWKDKNSSG